MAAARLSPAIPVFSREPGEDKPSPLPYLFLLNILLVAILILATPGTILIFIAAWWHDIMHGAILIFDIVDPLAARRIWLIL
jgi:hypothetical protein